MPPSPFPFENDFLLLPMLRQHILLNHLLGFALFVFVFYPLTSIMTAFIVTLPLLFTFFNFHILIPKSLRLLSGVKGGGVYTKDII